MVIKMTDFEYSLYKIKFILLWSKCICMEAAMFRYYLHKETASSALSQWPELVLDKDHCGGIR